LSTNANIPAWVHAVLAVKYLPQTFHNALALHCPKLLFPQVALDPQDSKDHNRCQNETYCTGLIHGLISPRDTIGIKVWM
jgi:hypothetical protein